MNRKFTLIIVTLMLGLTAWAGPVSRQQAKQNVQSFFASQSKSGARGMKRFAGAPQELTMELAEETTSFKVTIAMSPVGGETGIEIINDDARDQQPIYYDLQGRRVKNPTKGLYIMNGKKILVK